MKNDSVIFSFFGKVQKHLGRGKKLGYPTANVHVPVDTPGGIFFGYTKLEKHIYPSLIFVGSALTFNEIDKKAEVHILDFDEDIYDKFIEVEVFKKIRENEKFDSQEELVEQMKKDELEARKYLKEKTQLADLKDKKESKKSKKTKKKHTKSKKTKSKKKTKKSKSKKKSKK